MKARCPTTARRPGTAAPASVSATALRLRSSATPATRRTSGRSLPRPRRRCSTCSPAASRGRRPSRCCRRPATLRSACCGVRAPAGRSASTSTAPTAATPRLRRAIELGPEGVIRELKDSKLQGRGGAAFPTGVKWEAVARQPVRPHYLVCNADESEPGTFKDRVIMECDPFALIEAMTIAGYATGCERGFVYIRGEYPEAQHALEAALSEARSRGFLGEDVLGEGFGFDDRGAKGGRRVHLRRGDGDLRVDRGQPRRAAQQASVPRRPGAVRQADGRQQRRDARQRARDRPALRPVVCRDGNRGLDRHEAVLPLGARRRGPASTRCRSARRYASCSSSRGASQEAVSCSAS